MDTKQLFSLFIVVIMAASTIGFAVLYKTPDQQSKGGESNDTEIVQPTAIDFEAENVDATVQQLLPSVKIAAETVQTDISALNASIYGIKGVKKINSRFQQMEGTSLGMGFVFIADISFGKDYNAEYILAELERKVGLQGVDGYNYAVIKVPKKIRFTSVNKDLNLSKDFNFNENLLEGMVKFGTMVGDNLKVKIIATFLGAKATNQTAFEIQNISATPVQKTTELTAQITSLEKRLLLNGTVEYSKQRDAEELAKKIKSVSGVLDANISVQPPHSTVKPMIFVESPKVVDEEKFVDFNAFLYTLGAEEVYANNEDTNTNYTLAVLSFASGTAASEISEKRVSVEEKLHKLGISASIKETDCMLFGQIELTSENTKQTMPAIKAVISDKGIIADIQQPGKIALQQITDSETSTVYAVDSNETSALFKKSHIAGESTEMQITYYIARGKITEIQAMEK